MKRIVSQQMYCWLMLLFLSFALASCSMLAQRRWHSSLEQIDRAFTACTEKQLSNKGMQWVEVVHCGNDGARKVLAGSRPPYAELVEVALAQRLEVARQVDAGTLTEKEGTVRLAEINDIIHKFPGSLTALLSFSSAPMQN
jgi:hypothetical protein